MEQRWLSAGGELFMLLAYWPENPELFSTYRNIHNSRTNRAPIQEVLIMKDRLFSRGVQGKFSFPPQPKEAQSHFLDDG